MKNLGLSINEDNFINLKMNWTEITFSISFSFLAEWQWNPENAQIISYFNDSINLLQGFFIFLLLVCKKEIVQKLKHKFGIQNTQSATSGSNRSDGSGERKNSKLTLVTTIVPSNSCRDLASQDVIASQDVVASQDLKNNAESLEMNELTISNTDNSFLIKND